MSPPLPLENSISEPFPLALYKQKLAEWVAIQSVSAWPEKRGEIKRMMEVAAANIQRLGGSVELVDIGKQKVRAHRILPGGWEEAARS